MRRLRYMLGKDLRLLRRTPTIVVLLALYPALVAVLVGLAVGRPPTKPRVAIVNQVPANERTLHIGGKDFNLDKLTKALYDNVDGYDVATPGEALQDVRSGDAVAAVIIPEDIVQQLESSSSQGVITAIYDSTDPTRKSYVENTIKGLLVDTNNELTNRFTDVSLDYIDIIVNGGKITFGGKERTIKGLANGGDLIKQVLPYVPADQRKELEDFAQLSEGAKQGATFAQSLLKRVGQPIKLENKPVGTNSSLSSLAVAVAVAVSAMFVALLLGAGMLAYESEDQMLTRLLRGLASRWTIVTEKTLLAGLCAMVVGTVMVIAFGFFVDIRWERVWAWWPAIVLAGLAFGAAGVMIGAASGDVRAASLASFMIGLPLTAAALVPKGAVSEGLWGVLQVINSVFPFKPALDFVRAGLSPGYDALVPGLHLALLIAAYCLIAGFAIKRRVAT
ncbi:MAG: ABC transporter permease [Solirubrobacterales bacterium]